MTRLALIRAQVTEPGGQSLYILIKTFIFYFLFSPTVDLILTRVPYRRQSSFLPRNFFF